ncbi:MAG: DnaJ domain-containing protein [Polyangiaceae bacterium]|jgi:DnaJ-domain-containing protein 1
MADSLVPRPEPVASGNLARTPFVHLLLYALDKKLSGTLEFVAADKREVSIFCADGRPAKVRTSEPVAYLGRVLLEQGFLTEAVLQKSLVELAEQKDTERKLHGELLVSAGLLRQDQVGAGLVEQLRRKLIYASSLPAETTYSYYGAFDCLSGWGKPVPQGVDPFPLIWRMLHTAAPQEHIAAALARVGTARLRGAHGANFARLGLGKDEAIVVDLLSVQPLTVADLVKASGLDPSEARLLVYLLLITRQVEMVSTSDRALSIRPLMGGPATSVQAGAGVSASPPSHVSSAPPPKPSSNAMSGPPRSLATPTPVPPPVTMSDELAARWREIVERASSIDRADYFDMLGVPREASRKDIESAFYALARRWHPDRLPPELEPVRDACSRVFSRMSEALATLTDDEQRSHYMHLLADGSGTPAMQETVARVLEAASNFQKAEVCFKRNDWVQAESLCRRALASDATQADYHALLAWIVSLKPENQSPEKTLECIRMLDEAVFISERCEKAFYWRGLLYKRMGKNDAAIRDFKRATDLNPHNIDAAREVRLYQMRSGRGGTGSAPPAQRSSMPHKADPPPKPGLFQRLFRKPK